MQFAWVLLALSIAPAIAQDYCSLEVRVVDEKGEPVARVPVNYVEIDGNHGTSAFTNQAGIVRFCDLGLSRVHVRVRCHGTSITTRVEDIAPVWNKTVGVTILVPVACGVSPPDYFRIPYDRCTVLFRFETEDRKPIPNVSIAPFRPGATPLVSDSAGRIPPIVLDNKQSITTTASAPGYAPVPIEYTCAGPAERDQFVLLERRP